VVVALGLAWTWSLRRTVATRTAELQEQLVRRDASEREQARLQQQRDDLLERYRRLTDDSPDAIFVKSQDRVVYANAAAQRLLGAVSAESLSGMKFLDCIHPDDRPAVTECIEQLRRGEPAQFLEKRFLTLTGEVVDVELAGSPCMFDGNPAAQVVVRDVSARKRAERALLQRQREQTAIAEL